MGSWDEESTGASRILVFNVYFAPRTDLFGSAGLYQYILEEMEYICGLYDRTNFLITLASTWLWRGLRDMSVENPFPDDWTWFFFSHELPNPGNASIKTSSSACLELRTQLHSILSWRHRPNLHMPMSSLPASGLQYNPLLKCHEFPNPLPVSRDAL